MIKKFIIKIYQNPIFSFKSRFPIIILDLEIKYCLCIGRKYFWMAGNFVNFDKGEDNDEWAIANNFISVVPCQYDLTAHHAISILNDEWEF